ncbi:IQ domain-containing protein IQM5 like [Verticillium longisporum]|nr:IQ domain-containing protein IQM5 like [Verticillium longisporum]
MLRKSVRKNTWIFVADTNFRLYVGIKSSGAFQHSSFLQGSRISSAGLIKVKDGKIKSLSPLSGHYRPPTSNFRAFIRSLRESRVDVSHVSISKSLRESRVDVSHVSISKSYAVLVGLETYVRTRKKGKHVLQKMSLKKDKLVAPEAVARREEEERDKSESAAREREILEAEAAREQQEREEKSATVKLMRKLHIAPTDDDDDKEASTGNNAQQGAVNQVEEGDVSTQGGTTVRTLAAA